MRTKNYWRTLAVGMMAMLTIAGMSSCCGDDDEAEQLPPEEVPADDPEQGQDPTDNPEEQGEEPGEPGVYHPISADTRTLLEVTDISTIDPEKLGEIIGNWPMFTYAGEEAASVLKPAIKAAARTRLPQMDKLFKQRVGTAEDGSRQWNLRRYVFTYKSVSGVTGNDTTLVGSVIFPTNTLGQPHELDVLTLYHRQAYMYDSWLPSQAVTLMALHALHNSAVIEPDGQGATESMPRMLGENMQGDLTALQMADCTLAALEIMRTQGVTLAEDGYTNSWGTSLGSMSAAGFAYYMENTATEDFKQLLKLRASYIGEGPTNFWQLNGFPAFGIVPPVQKYQVGWHPTLPFYISTCPNDELINYDSLKKYYNLLRTMPDGAINENVHWLDLYIPHTELEKKMGERIGNHLMSATITLFAVSQVKDPEDMAKVEFLGHIAARFAKSEK